MSKLQKKPSALKRGHPTLQNIHFYKFFSTFVGHFCLPGSRIQIQIPNPDPDPLARLSTDPKPWKKVSKTLISTVLWLFIFQDFSKCT